MFAYLEKKHNARIVFDPTYPDLDMSVFKECDWKEFYGNITEAIPPNAPKSRGKETNLRLFCDSDHAGDKLRRCLRSGFLIYIISALIVWYSKPQATIETSVFGAEFVAMKHGMEALRGLRYKLRMMGVAISGPSYIICYHAIHEAVAMGECVKGHIRTHKNPADLCTKLMSAGIKRDHLVGLILRECNIADHA
jgi:hypothetical protein